jgi:hypothetical protein
LSILADRQWRILHRPIDLAIGNAWTDQNNKTDNGDNRAETRERATIDLIPH